MSKIIEVQEHDAATLLPLLRDVQGLHVDAHPDIFRSDTSDEEMESFLRAFLSRATVTALAHHSVDGIVNGYLIYEVQTRGESALKTARQVGFLHQVAVKKSLRGQGIGSKLADEMKSRLRAMGISRLCSEHFSFNEPSASFLRSLGMTPIRITVEGDL
ncbi:MAG: GNAT family N-acetyltransferase [Pseudomonadota bacterium]